MPEWSQGDILANGVRIHYYRTGHGQTAGRRPIVLLHGFSDNGLCWTPVARALEADYDVIMLDARGHGLSEAPLGPYGGAAMAEDVVAAVDALGLDAPVVMGHSMGGVTALVAAGRNPSRFHAVILEDPVLYTEQEEQAFREAHEARRAAGEQPDNDGWLMALRNMTYEERVTHCRRESPLWAEAELGPWATSKAQMSLNVLAGPWEDEVRWRDLLPRIACPVLVLVPEVALGGLTSPAAAALAATLIRQGEVVDIPAAGHSVRRDQFESFMGAVRAFLDDAGTHV